MCVSLNGTYLCTVCTAVCLRPPESSDDCSPVLATLQYTPYPPLPRPTHRDLLREV